MSDLPTTGADGWAMRIHPEPPCACVSRNARTCFRLRHHIGPFDFGPFLLWRCECPCHGPNPDNPESREPREDRP